MVIVYCLVVVVLAALVVAIYVGTGGRAWLGTRESPEEIIGRTVRLSECDGLGQSPPDLPAASVTRRVDSGYRLDFASPFVFDGREERFAHIYPRHTGYPISSAASRATFVTATLESGRGFIAKLSVL
jgi:hypothetical protein